MNLFKLERLMTSRCAVVIRNNIQFALYYLIFILLFNLPLSSSNFFIHYWSDLYSSKIFTSFFFELLHPHFLYYTLPMHSFMFPPPIHRLHFLFSFFSHISLTSFFIILYNLLYFDISFLLPALINFLLTTIPYPPLASH